MEAEGATGVTQISPGRPRWWEALSTLIALLQVSMEAESATWVMQIFALGGRAGGRRSAL
eukprot:8717812-Karenia_brevis.AAC.1